MEPKKTNPKVVSLVVLAAVVVLVEAISMMNGKEKQGTADSNNITAAAQQANDTAASTDTSTATATSTSSDTSTQTAASAYKAGTYEASASYSTPESVETINVTLTIDASGTVTESSVSQNPQDRESAEYQSRFADNYKTKVVGKSIASLSLSNVSGASLTPIGFNKAVSQIRTKAAI